MQALVSEADRALDRLDGSIQTLPDSDLFVLMYVRKEAVLSSQIEGTQSSLHDLLRAEAQLFDPDSPKDVEEVSNYVAAMNHGLGRLSELPVSTRLIREIHERLLQGVRGARMLPGEIRQTQNWIGPVGTTLRNASFVPPPPHEVPRLLSELEAFIHEKDRRNIVEELGRVAGNALRIHESLFPYPIVTVNTEAEALGISFTAANRLIDRMVEVGILKEITGHARNRVFSYFSYIDLFSDDRPPG